MKKSNDVNEFDNFMGSLDRIELSEEQQVLLASFGGFTISGNNTGKCVNNCNGGNCVSGCGA